MAAWEYRKLDLNDVPHRRDQIDLMREAGEEGWQLIVLTDNLIAYFKRELDGDQAMMRRDDRQRTISNRARHRSSTRNEAR